MKTIYLIRHGETNFNTDPEPRVRGRIEVPLNEDGLRHADQVGDFLKTEKIQKIYYSSIHRAKQTADAVKKYQHDAEFIEEPLMIDISWGDWEGKTYTEAFGDKNGGEYMKDPSKLQIPNGESFYQVLDRIKKMIHKILDDPTTDNVCIVSHGAVLNLLGCYILEAPLKKFWTVYMSACGVSKITARAIDDYSINYWNHNQHLK